MVNCRDELGWPARSQRPILRSSPFGFDHQRIDRFAAVGSLVQRTSEYAKIDGHAKKREACGKLLEQVHDGLRAVTLRGPDWETMQVSLHRRAALGWSAGGSSIMYLVS